MAEPIICPFCSTSYLTEYQAQYHIEEQHTDDSPFVLRESTLDGLGSTVDHGRLQGKDLPISNEHDATASVETRSGETPSLRGLAPHSKTHKKDDNTRIQRDKVRAESGRTRRQTTTASVRLSTQAKTKPSPLRTEKGRLGRRELGQHAFEQSMPISVRKSLENAARPVIENQISKSGTLMRTIRYPNETSDLIPAFADLLAHDNAHDTILCHPSVRHIQRVKCDGNFCGYWNTQMLLTFILAETSSQRGLPTVLQIQATIEQAWSEGICSYGKQETGGIYNTRKWIGTHEALAFFTKIGVRCLTGSFQDDCTTGRPAATALLHFVQDHFSQQDFDRSTSVTVTSLAPIYLQRAGHSVTIIGIRRRKSTGELSLLALDSSLAVSSKVFSFKGNAARFRDAEACLQPYLRTESQLARWNEYEVLTITDHSGLVLREQDE